MSVIQKKSWNMEKSTCNVIWVDDDIDNICPEFGSSGLKNYLKKEKIDVIGKAHSFVEFKGLMANCKDRVDAIITDANFNDVSRAVAKDNDFKGLIKMLGIIESYNERRDIPFYLYSGKGAYFNFQNGELDYFDINGRRFNKGDYEKMFKRIREDVEHINSPSFRIRKKYAKELEAAALIEGNGECLMDALLYDYSDEWEKTEDYFNPIRKIAESIFDECKTLRIIPPIIELNAISRFLNYGQYENYSLSEGKEIMPKPLARSLWYFLDITQDGSHKKGDLKLGVDKYVRDTKNINLFRTILYIVMDLCLWFKSVKKTTEDESFAPKWYMKEADDAKETKIDEDSIIATQQEGFEHEGIVKKKGLRVYYCDHFYLQHHNKSGKYKEGDKIRIKKSKEIKEPFINGEGEEVTRFVNLRDIVKLE